MNEPARMRRAMYPRNMTLREAKIAIGGPLGWIDRVKYWKRGETIEAADARATAEEDRIENSTLVLRTTDPLQWICGRFEPEDACSAPGCVFFSEALCDYPMGRGKTCDAALCPGHAHSIGADRDLCEIHFSEHMAKTGGAIVRPWPPKRGA